MKSQQTGIVRQSNNINGNQYDDGSFKYSNNCQKTFIAGSIDEW